MAWQEPKINWTRADGVRDADLNRIEGNAQHLYSDVSALKQHIDDTLYAISQRVALNDLPIGAEFALYENGTLVPFIKINDNYKDTGRTLVVRKSSYMASPLQEGSVGYYDGCMIDVRLNQEYINMLDDATRAVLTNVDIDVVTFSGMSTISRKIFLLSKTEYNFSGSPVEGAIQYYFINPGRRVANFDGIAYEHWTRTVIFSSEVVHYVTNTGVLGSGHPIEFTAGVRPAFTLPGTFNVVVSVPSAAYILANAEVI